MGYICKYSFSRFLYLTSIVHQQTLHSKLCKAYLCKNVRNIGTGDAMDEFTIQLMAQKTRKWNTNNSEKEVVVSLLTNSTLKKSLIKNLKSIIELKDLNVDVRNFSVDQIDSLIESASNADKPNEIELILNQCIKYHQPISSNVIFKLFSMFSKIGDIRMILLLQKLCKLTNLKLFNSHSEFEYYLGVAYWKKGNINNALNVLENTYKKSNKTLRNTLMIILQLLISDVVKNNSEASNVILKKYMVRYVEQYNEHYPMILFWESCWLSDWFKDQQLSESLLDQHEFLLTFIINKAAIISSLALKRHQEDAVLRLIQILLKRNLMHQCTLVMRNLFDYKYKMNDSRGCSEIVKNCIPLKIKLTSFQYNKHRHKCFDIKLPQENNEKPKTFNLKF